MPDQVLEDNDLQDQDVEPAKDPGQLEGVKDKDPSDKLTPDHPRFKEVYGKMKDQERANEDLQNQLKEQKSAMDMMKEHNERIATSLEEIKKKPALAQDPRPQVGPGPDELNNLQAMVAKAMEDEDWGRAMTLQNQIWNTRIQDVQPVKTETIVEQIKDELSKNDNSKAYRDWVGAPEQEWYRTNVEVKGKADAYGEGLIATGKYSYDQVLDMVSEAFGPGKNNGANHASVEAGGSVERGRMSKKSSKVTLTEDEKKTAAMFHISESDFLAQKKADLAARGEQ